MENHQPILVKLGGNGGQFKRDGVADVITLISNKHSIDTSAASQESQHQ